MSDENKEEYQLGDYKLIQYQIPQTNITRTVWQTVKRITNDILEVKGLTWWNEIVQFLKCKLNLHDFQFDKECFKIVDLESRILNWLTF